MKKYKNGSQWLSGNEIKIRRPGFWKGSRLPACICLGLLAYYLTLFLSYRPYDIDNPWFLSFSYNTCIEHIDTDQFLNARFPAGMDGTQYFGKIAAYTQCGLLSHAAWQQWPATVLSAAFITFALALWWLQLARLGHSLRTRVCFLIIVGFSEPFVSAANKARYESLSFMLVSLGLLLVVYEYPLLGSFIIGLSVELEPAAAAGLIPLVVLAFFGKGRNRTVWTKLALGLGAAAICYLALHPHILSIFNRAGSWQSSSPLFSGGFFYAYFLSRIRHIPELVCLVLAAFAYWNRRVQMRSHYLAVSAAGLTFFSVLMPHGNAAYMIFAYPFFVGMALLAFDADYYLWTTIAVTVLLFLPQQFVLLVMTRKLGLHSVDVAALAKAIGDAGQRRGVAKEDLRVYGDYRLWFAHPHFFRAAAYGTIENINDADLYICYDKPPQPVEFEPQYLLYCGDLKRLLALEPVDVLSVRGESLTIYVKR